MTTELEAPPVLETPAAIDPTPAAPTEAATPTAGEQPAAPPAIPVDDGLSATAGSGSLLEKAFNKIQEDKKAGEGGEAGLERGPDGKFLPKAGAKPAEAEAAPALGADGKPVAAAPAETAPTIEELEKTIPTMGSKDKKRYTAWVAAQKAIQAKADTATARAAEFEAKVKEYETKAATPAAVPKEIEDELAALRPLASEYDLVRTPKFQREFEAPITSTVARIEKALVETWKARGFTDAQIAPHLEVIKQNKFSWQSVTGDLDETRKAGRIGDAARIEGLLTQKENLEEKRAEAIANQSSQNAQTAAQRAEAFKAQQTTQQKMQELAVRSTGEAFAGAEAELKKVLPSLIAPEPPSDKDTPAVAQSKRAARAEYDNAVNAVRADFARFAPDPNDAEKTAKLTGEFQSLVLLGLLAKSHLLPRAAKEIAAREASIAELNVKYGAIKKAGAINSAHLAAAQDPKDGVNRVGAAVPNSTLGDGRTLEATMAAMNAKARGGI